MKIRAKIMVLITTVLFLTAGLIGSTSIWQLKRNGEMAIRQIERLGTEKIKKIEADGKRQQKNFRQEVLLRKKEYLKSHIQIALSILQKSFKDTEKLTEDGLNDEVKKAIVSQQKEDIAQFIGTIRYGPENKDYFWINDIRPTMIMHPFKPKLNGNDLSSIKDPDGKKIFIEFVKVCDDKGEGFVDYSWPKYGADKPQPKLSFVKLFKDWGWIIGTGIYIDDIDIEVNARKTQLNQEIKTAEKKLLLQTEEQRDNIKDNIKRILWLLAAVTLVIVVLALACSVVFAQRNIVKPISSITEGLNQAADQVASASGQVSASSQSLAEGSSEQAASIEETSASLEQMSSMTKRNADNSAQADSLMKNADGVIAEANQSMTDLTHSMDEISKASEDTSKIIKTIDEIAFQTNLLALNAAVEAARAGEAGTGFAVVADEVRNLALRAAEAAKNTAELIDGTVKKVNDGTDLVERTNTAFAKVAKSATKVGELVSEISAASKEQSQGIDEVNQAVIEMDKVTQQNAANAEESASASEEMSAQAEEMKGYVGNLVALVGGKTVQSTRAYAQQGPKKARVDHSGIKRVVPGKTKALAAVPTKKKGPSPEEVIPLDDDFADF